MTRFPSSGVVAAVMAAALGLGSGAAHAQQCKAIKFAPGTVSAEVRGVAPAEGVRCYTLRTGAGQTAALRVTEGRNTAFSIEGLVDARDAYTFRTEAKTYRILVLQVLRAAAGERFRMTVRVTGRAAGGNGSARPSAPAGAGAWRGREAGVTGSMSALAADGMTRISLFCRRGGPRRATLQLTGDPDRRLPRRDGRTGTLVFEIDGGSARRVTLTRHDGNDQWWDAVDAIGGGLLNALAAGGSLRLLTGAGDEVAVFSLSGSARARSAIRRQCGF
ncbi:MAG: hypothetical protein AAFR16_08370 [Pseudomonadota bacterium]